MLLTFVMDLKTGVVWLVSLFICFTILISETKATTKTSRRSRRSGGYPKFPIAASMNDAAVSPSLKTICGIRDIEFNPSFRGPKIVGGIVPPYGAYPWQVEIAAFDEDKKRWNHHCGGAIIGDGHLIVTAAHCLQAPVRVDTLRVVAGDHDLEAHDQYEQILRVETMIAHPDFRKDGPYSNDIALLKVSGFSFGGHVRSICLPESRSVPPPGTRCSVTGWGALKGDELNNIARLLHVASVPIVESEVCRRGDVYGGRQQAILDTMVCAGSLRGGTDACGGDSGGPLACASPDKTRPHTLVGLVSWGDGCAKRNRPGVYTRVDAFVEWIRKTARTLGVDSPN